METILIMLGTILQMTGALCEDIDMPKIKDFIDTYANYIGIIASIIGIIVGIIAIIQAFRYNKTSNKLNQKTEEMQQFIKQSIIHSNFINMYTFIVGNCETSSQS